MAFHQLRASPHTIRVSVFDAAFAPVMTVNSGDTVEIQCISGRKEVLPPPGSGHFVPPELSEVIAANPGMRPGHILTGPIEIADAMPGDMLEIHVDDIKPGADWGYTALRPLAGTLPDDVREPVLYRIAVNIEQMSCILPWGTTLPLAPFLGIMAVAPPPAYGLIRSSEPRIHGGNIDNKELTAGSTLFLPVWVPGANFSAGDGHGVQGDGEVCVTALEMCLTATLTFLLHKVAPGARPLFERPRAETPTHFISMGFHASLDEAMKLALREMIAFICERTNLDRAQAYAFCSLAVDFHVTQTVNGEKGVHGMLKKGLLF